MTTEEQLRITPAGAAVIVEDPYATLSQHCAAAGLTQRQTAAVLGAARGQTDAEIASRLLVSVQAAAEAVRCGVRKLQQRYGSRERLSGLEASELLQLLRNRRSCKPSSGAGGPVAIAFGMVPADLVTRSRDEGTRPLLELACRLQGVALPTLVRPRLKELPKRRHPAGCRCRKCAARCEREIAAGAKNRRERRSLRFAGIRPVK